MKNISVDKIPTLRSARTSPGPNGSAAHEIRLNINVRTGANRNSGVFAWLGRIGSFTKSFKPSERMWRRIVEVQSGRSWSLRVGAFVSLEF